MVIAAYNQNWVKLENPIGNIEVVYNSLWKTLVLIINIHGVVTKGGHSYSYNIDEVKFLDVVRFLDKTMNNVQDEIFQLGFNILNAVNSKWLKDDRANLKILRKELEYLNELKEKYINYLNEEFDKDKIK